MIQITNESIDTEEVLRSVASNLSGASLLFVGTTREFTGDRKTDSLEYECFGQMAKKKMVELAGEAIDRWSLTACSIVHRVGPVGLGEASVAIAVSSPHRKNAFEAGEWLIDRLKQVVPIWKKELWSDGTSEWVHPGVQPDRALNEGQGA